MHPRTEDEGRLVPWWRGATLYQIYPRSFADSNGDGIGDLPGITAHLDYIAALGVDGLWISPFYRSPMRDFGYDVTDHCDVDPIFGTLADFDRLLHRAHALGLKVIIDQVYSHTSDQHPWFEASRADRNNPQADWYVWADPKPEGSPPCNWQSVFGGPAWMWDARRCQYFLHNFLPEQPDLDVHAPAVQEALLAIGRFWLDRGVDGFRLDAIDFAMHDPQLRDNPPRAPGSLRTRGRGRPVDYQQPLYNKGHPELPDFLSRIRTLTDQYPGTFTVAEVGGDGGEATMKSFTRGSDRLHSAYGFNFLYASRLTAELVRSALEAWPEEPGVGWPSWAFSNHDAPRVVSRWAAPAQRERLARTAMLLLACLRGNLFVYQGEELGLAQAEIAYEDLQDPEARVNWPRTLGRDGARTPMPWRAGLPHAGFSSARPWLPVPDVHIELAVDAQERDPGSMLNLTRRILHLRRQSPALRTGRARVIEARDGLLLLERCSETQRLLCAFNLGKDSCGSALQAKSRRVLIAVNGADGAELPPLSGMILEDEPQRSSSRSSPQKE